MSPEISHLILGDGSVVKDARFSEQQFRDSNDIVFDRIEFEVLTAHVGPRRYRCYLGEEYTDINASAVVWVYYHKEP